MDILLPPFEPKKERVDPNGNPILAFVPLQAADWLAYEILQDYKAIQSSRNLRWAGGEFDQMRGEINIFESENLLQLVDIVEQMKPVRYSRRKTSRDDAQTIASGGNENA